MKKMLNQKDKEKIVIGLFRKGSSNKEIAEKANISERDIRKYVQNYVNRNEEEKEKVVERSTCSNAYGLYRQNKKPFEVASMLNISASEALEYYNGYLQLTETDDFLEVFNKWWSSTPETRRRFLQMYYFITSKGYSQEEIIDLLRLVNKDLPFLYAQEDKVKRNLTDVSLMLETKQTLVNNGTHTLKQIEMRTNGITRICNDMGQEIQKMEQQKNRLDILIKALNNDEIFLGFKILFEDIVKDNIKDIYSIVRILIAVLSIICAIRKIMTR